jgi:hypothetical protein
MSERKVEIFETTAGQIAALLARLGISEQQRVTVLIEPDDWISKARRAARPLVVAAGLTDDDIDHLIDEARTEVQPQLK